MNVPLIHNKLYLGDLEDAKRLLPLGYATVCIAGDETLRQGRPTYGVYLEDREDIDPTVFKNAMFLSAMYIHEALMHHPRVLVHCYAGINRSVSALVAYSTIYGPNRYLTPSDVIMYLTVMNAKKRGVRTMTNRRFESLLTGK